MNQGRKKARVGNITLETFHTYFSELSKDNTKAKPNMPANQNQNTNESINVAFTNN